MAHNERDRSIERLVRRGAARASEPSTADACVDAETLAAWSAGSLRPDELAQVQDHVADCQRCLSVAAAFARTDAIAAAPLPWWHRWRLRLVVPVAAAATAALLWLVVPPRDAGTPPRFDATGERAETANTAVAPAAPPAAPAPTSTPPPSRVTPAPALGPRAAEGRQAEERRSKIVPPRDEGLAAAAPLRAPAAGPGSTAGAAAPPATVSAAPAAAPPPTAPKTAAESVAVAADALRFAAAPAALEVHSPAGTNRWRASSDGSIERSVDGGDTWSRLETASFGGLTAGHSPAESVVWLVGRDGVIVMSANGLRFDRIAFVEPVDLVAVVAVDARQATVTTADGRRFATMDGGVTWTVR